MGVAVTGEEGETERRIVREGKCLQTSAPAVAPAPAPEPHRDVEIFFPPSAPFPATGPAPASLRSPSSQFAPYREFPQNDVEVFSPPRSPSSPFAPYRKFSSLKRTPQQLQKRPQPQRRPVWWWFFG